ncbi:MAG: propionyl-CoA synthetase, partial [Verrucomicrobia bacterium]|nr:propionyl-CoA synthetase [Verrucomicrobiota bacterium]
MSTSLRAQEFCQRALTDRDSFWSEQAKAIHWEHPIDQVCDFSRPPFSRWFVGGRTNLCYNAVDRHLQDRAVQPALHFISTEVETERTFTFQELYDEVNTFAA